MSEWVTSPSLVGVGWLVELIWLPRLTSEDPHRFSLYSFLSIDIRVVCLVIVVDVLEVKINSFFFYFFAFPPQRPTQSGNSQFFFFTFQTETTRPPSHVSLCWTTIAFCVVSRFFLFPCHYEKECMPLRQPVCLHCPMVRMNVCEEEECMLFCWQTECRAQSKQIVVCLCRRRSLLFMLLLIVVVASVSVFCESLRAGLSCVLLLFFFFYLFV